MKGLAVAAVIGVIASAVLLVRARPRTQTYGEWVSLSLSKDGFNQSQWYAQHAASMPRVVVGTSKDDAAWETTIMDTAQWIGEHHPYAGNAASSDMMPAPRSVITWTIDQQSAFANALIIHACNILDVCDVDSFRDETVSATHIGNFAWLTLRHFNASVRHHASVRILQMYAELM